MVERIIELSVRYKWAVFGAVLALAVFAADAARRTPLDALPDLSDPQVVLVADWMCHDAPRRCAATRCSA